MQRRTCTGVGMWPPSVGLPMVKPSAALTAATTSSRLESSRLSVLTATPPLVMPRLTACASAAVLPYALAYMTTTLLVCSAATWRATAGGTGGAAGGAARSVFVHAC